MHNLITQIVDGRTDLVHELAAVGLPATSTDDHDVPLIKWCAYYGDVSAIRQLLANGETISSLGPNLDLNGAAFHGHWQLCAFLLEQGADPNQPLPDTGETPLHAALCKPLRPRVDNVVRVLLSSGADPNQAARTGVETGSFMRDVRTRGETPLHRAAAFGSLQVIRLLLEAGGDREARDANGDSPLSWASWHLRPAAVLSALCFGRHSVHPDAIASDDSDHGHGWGGMDHYLLGTPHDKSGRQVD